MHLRRTRTSTIVAKGNSYDSDEDRATVLEEGETSSALDHVEAKALAVEQIVSKYGQHSQLKRSGFANNSYACNSPAAYAAFGPPRETGAGTQYNESELEEMAHFYRMPDNYTLGSSSPQSFPNHINGASTAPLNISPARNEVEARVDHGVDQPAQNNENNFQSTATSPDEASSSQLLQSEVDTEQTEPESVGLRDRFRSWRSTWHKKKRNMEVAEAIESMGDSADIKTRESALSLERAGYSTYGTEPISSAAAVASASLRSTPLPSDASMYNADPSAKLTNSSCMTVLNSAGLSATATSPGTTVPSSGGAVSSPDTPTSRNVKAKRVRGARREYIKNLFKRVGGKSVANQEALSAGSTQEALAPIVID